MSIPAQTEKPCTHEIVFEPETANPDELLACVCGMYTATVREFQAEGTSR